MLGLDVAAICGVELLTTHQVVVNMATEEDYWVFLRQFEGRTLH